jgi:hypothetical protein
MRVKDPTPNQIKTTKSVLAYFAMINDMADHRPNVDAILRVIDLIPDRLGGEMPVPSDRGPRPDLNPLYAMRALPHKEA